jgi:hypothetical protein
MLHRLRGPFGIDVCAATFQQLHTLLSVALPAALAETLAEANDATAILASAGGTLGSGLLQLDPEAVRDAACPWTCVIRALLHITRAHLVVLTASGTDLAAVGISSGATASNKPAIQPSNLQPESLRAMSQTLADRGDLGASTHVRGTLQPSVVFDPNAAAILGLTSAGPSPVNTQSAPAIGGNRGEAGEPTLAPLHRLLEHLSSGGRSPKGAADGSVSPISATALPVELQGLAADVIDAGLPILYPTRKLRLRLLASLVSEGAVVDAAFRLPASRNDFDAKAAAAAVRANAEKAASANDTAATKGKVDDKAVESETAVVIRKLDQDPRFVRLAMLLQVFK